MPHEKLLPGEIEVLIDGASDDVAFDWLLIHLGIRSNPTERPGPPTVEEAHVALSALETLVTAGLVRVGRVEYIDGGPPGRLAPVKHVSEPIDVVRRRVVSHLESGDSSDDWRWLFGLSTPNWVTALLDTPLRTSAHPRRRTVVETP